MDQRRRARDYTRSVSGRDDRLRSMSRTPDFMPTLPAKPQPKTETADELLHGSEEKRRVSKQRWRVWRQIRTPRLRTLVIVICSLLVLSGAGYAFIWWSGRSAPPSNPFSASVMASIKVPLYYPTKLPPGFHIDKTSIKEPQGGVVVFSLKGPSKHPIYISEEARLSKFDLGGFYNSFDQLKEIVIPGGVIAVGYTNTSDTTRVGSRAIGQTWVVTNTNAPVTPDQLVSMLKSLTLSY